MAGAAELVGGLVPGNDTAKVSAHGVDAEGLEGAVSLGDEVSGITLRTPCATSQLCYESCILDMCSPSCPTNSGKIVSNF